MTSWYDFAVAIQDEALSIGLLDKKIAINPILSNAYPTPARRPHYSVLDSSALRDIVNVSGLHWRQALKQMLKNLK